MLCYIKYYAVDLDIAIVKLGTFSALTSVLSYGAPLSSVVSCCYCCFSIFVWNSKSKSMGVLPGGIQLH